MTYDDTYLSIIIPTYKRPDSLARALASVEKEKVTGLNIEIIIADNDPKASAKSFMEQKIKESSANIIYIHVPEPGVSNARNSALDTARGRYILFLDDDMEAAPPWAQSMVDAAEKFDAALVFGPVNAVMPDPPSMASSTKASRVPDVGGGPMISIFVSFKAGLISLQFT